MAACFEKSIKDRDRNEKVSLLLPAKRLARQSDVGCYCPGKADFHPVTLARRDHPPVRRCNATDGLAGDGTTAKAKALRKYVEPLITKSKEDTTHSRRTVFSYLQDKYAVTELFKEISQKIAERPGGYTRIIKTGNRLGDNASMCFIELVDYDENMMKDTAAKKAPKTRRSRKKSAAAAEAPVAEAPATEAPAEEKAAE